LLCFGEGRHLASVLKAPFGRAATANAGAELATTPLSALYRSRSLSREPHMSMLSRATSSAMPIEQRVTNAICSDSVSTWDKGHASELESTKVNDDQPMRDHNPQPRGLWFTQKSLCIEFCACPATAQLATQNADNAHTVAQIYANKDGSARRESSEPQKVTQHDFFARTRFFSTPADIVAESPLQTRCLKILQVPGECRKANK
jgi:hypothetical protein